MFPGHELYGRRAEREVLDRLFERLRAGGHAVLVLRGEPGEGKTALLDYLSEKSAGARIIRVTGVQSEMELAYAGLHQLCLPLLDQLHALPPPQRDALGVAFGLADGAPPDHFLVGLAALTLLSGASDSQPLVCLIDDVQWLDRASVQALAFVARRLMADPIAVVFAELEPADVRELRGLPELLVTGLDDRAARALLTSAVPALLDERVQDRIIAEAHGNPLALLELPEELTATELGGWLHLPKARPLESRSGRVERAYARRLRVLPAQTRQFLLLAAVEPLGDPTVLWRAAAVLGLDGDVSAPAEATGLITLGMRVGFCHPLARSAVHNSATPGELRQAHHALAEVTDRRTDPDRRAWHLAAAAAVPDEWLAGELERSADRARARGGAAAEAVFLRRSAELTPDTARRGGRAVAAAQAALAAGDSDAADELLGTAEMNELNGLQLARVERLRAQSVFTRSRGPDAPPLLLEAARRLSPFDVPLARETYLEALLAAAFAGDEHLPPGHGVRAVAEAARLAPAHPGPPDQLDLLLDGLTVQFTQGFETAAPILRRALDAQHEPDRVTLICLTASLVAMELWDETAWLDLLERYVHAARESGTLSLLPMAMDFLAGLHLQTGNFVTAAALVEETAGLRATMRAMLPPYVPILLAAWRGDPSVTATLAENASRGDESGALVVADYATAVVNNGLGRYRTALAAAQRATTTDQMVARSWGLAELAEAAARLEEWDIGEAALRELTERTDASGTPWAAGTEARTRALLTRRSDDVDDLYRVAIERFRESGMKPHLARAHLVYGEWLRRNNRRTDARDHLRHAHHLLANMGAEAFDQRARNELMATGEAVRQRTTDALDLTPQEALIASLARDGRTNQEIASELFISPRTVEWHLHNVFAKLAIGSRRELRDAPLDAGIAATSAG